MSRVDAGVGDAPVTGLIADVSGPTQVGWRIIDVWKSEEDYERFVVARLRPALQAAGQDVNPPSRPFEALTVTSVDTRARRG